MEQFFVNLMMNLTDLPGRLVFLAYVAGIVFVIAGAVTVFKVVKLKQKGNANRAFFFMFFGGFWFCLPGIFEVMLTNPGGLHAPATVFFIPLFFLLSIIFLFKWFLQKKPTEQKD